MGFFNSREDFTDGSAIWPIHRDEFVFARSDGYLVEVFIFLTGGPNEFDRVLVMSSLEHWTRPQTTEISIEDRMNIVSKFSQYKKFTRARLGIGVSKDKDPISVDSFIAAETKKLDASHSQNR